MRFAAAATALAGISTTAAIAQAPKSDQHDSGEIVVHGRRSDEYRIPEELRTLPAERSERWRKQVGGDLSCQHVGPRGCGTPLMPIFTVGGDGKVRIGQKDGGK